MSTDLNDIPDEIRGVVAQFDSTLGDIEEHLKPILSGDTRNIVKNLDPIDRAKLQLAMAYAVNSLFFMYLRTQGIDARNHPVRDGLERVQRYMSKIKAAQFEAERQQLKIDKEAARRFIMHSLPVDKAHTNNNTTTAASSDGDSHMQEADNDLQPEAVSQPPKSSRGHKTKKTHEDGDPPKKKKHKKRHTIDSSDTEQNHQ